jgi:hypothetical protein
MGSASFKNHFRMPFTLAEAAKFYVKNIHVLSSTIMYLAQQIAADGIWD